MAKKTVVLVSIVSIVLTVLLVYGYKGVLISGFKTTKSEFPNYSSQLVKSSSHVVPVVIIGAGPAGLSAGLYSSAQYDTVIIEGHAPSLLTETSYVDNWLASPHELGATIIERSRKQVEAAGAKFIECSVTGIDCSQWPYVIHLDDGTTLQALSIIVATGARPRMLGVKGEREYWSKGVSACARCDAHFYSGKDVVVVGGGDSAIEEAIELARFAKKVTIVHRRNQLRAASRMQTRLNSYAEKINVVYDAHVQEIVGNDNFVTGVIIRHNSTGTVETIPADGCFLAVGHEPNTTLFKGILEMDNQGYLVLDYNSQRTSVSGVFAAGEVADSQYRQAIVAAGDGAKAAIDAIEFLESTGFTLNEAVALRNRSVQTAQA